MLLRPKAHIAIASSRVFSLSDALTSLFVWIFCLLVFQVCGRSILHLLVWLTAGDLFCFALRVFKRLPAKVLTTS
jgi:hypothetical protein